MEKIFDSYNDELKSKLEISKTRNRLVFEIVDPEGSKIYSLDLSEIKGLLIELNNL